MLVDSLKQRVDERRDARHFADQEQHADDQERDDKRNQPEALALPEKRQQLAHRARAARNVAESLHGVSYYYAKMVSKVDYSLRNSHLCRISRSITSASRPLRANVLMASPGVFTIGSPRRLNDVFITTGTPVARPNREIKS